MPTIFVDTEELAQLGGQYMHSVQELSGVVSDIRRRLVTTNFAAVTPYGIDVGPTLDDVKRVCNRLTDDVFRLERADEELRHTLAQAAPGQPGALGPYGSVISDLWWFNRHPKPDELPVDGAAAPVGAPPGVAGIGEDIVATARKWLGTPYLWGGGHGAITDTAGSINVDCSGLVSQAFGLHGRSDVRGTTYTMWDMGTPVDDLANARAGDLLFWGPPSNIHHVAIYVGNGMMIEAPHTGAVVREVPVRMSDFAGIRRVL